jgi:hypothetical protein
MVSSTPATVQPATKMGRGHPLVDIGITLVLFACFLVSCPYRGPAEADFTMNWR